MAIEKNMKLKLPTGELIKVIDVTDTLIYAKTLGAAHQTRMGYPISPLYVYAKSDFDALDGLGYLEELLVEPKKD